MENKFAFLGSPRFWALVIGACALALWQDGIISQAWVTAIGTITGGFIGIRTVDRATEQKVKAAAVVAGTLPPAETPVETFVMEK